MNPEVFKAVRPLLNKPHIRKLDTGCWGMFISRNAKQPRVVSLRLTDIQRSHLPHYALWGTK